MFEITPFVRIPITLIRRWDKAVIKAQQQDRVPVLTMQLPDGAKDHELVVIHRKDLRMLGIDIK
jgi:hypothetical protein